MTEPTLEQRVAALERQVAELKGAKAVTVGARWFEQIGPSFKGDSVFAEMQAYGRYFRKTGQEPPPDWKPGDPIPEPGDGEELP